jgi:hypothetical protein
MKLFGKIDSKTFEWLLAAAVVLPHLLIVFGNLNAVLNWFLTDDAFYYFQVARHISEGLGSTFDGINFSNGYHPLWMLVCIPVFSLARYDLILPLRLLVLVMAAFNAGTAVVLFRLLNRFIKIELAGMLAVLWAFSLEFHRLTTKEGLETGINAFFIVLLWEKLTSLNKPEGTTTRDLGEVGFVGLIAALTILSRLDNVYLVIASAVWLWLRWWQPPNGNGSDLREKWLWRLKTGLAYNSVIVAVILPYLMWNKHFFGDFMPVSGQVKLWWGSLPNSVYGYRVTNLQELIAEMLSADNKVGPWALVVKKLFQGASLISGFRPQDTIILPTVWKLTAVLAVLLMALVWLERDFFFKTAARMGLLPFLLGTLVQASYYKRFGSVPQKAWYWIGEMIFIMLCFGLVLMLLYRLLSRLKLDWPQKAAMAVMLLVMLWAPVNLTVYLFGELENGREQEVHDYTDRAIFLAETFEPGTVIGIPGSGSWAYFSPEMVIFNMDGLINSYAYLDAMREGRGAEFMAQSGVQYVIGNPYIMQETNPYGPMLEGHLEMYAKYFPPYGNRRFVWQFIP